MDINLDDNPLTRVVEQAGREYPSLYQTFAHHVNRFQEAATARDAAHVLVLLTALVCKEQACTPREAIAGMQQHITSLDARVASTGLIHPPTTPP